MSEEKITKKLTLQDLKEMRPGVFAKGETIDSSLCISMTYSGRLLKWVASRGGIHDWAIYCHFAENSWQRVKEVGYKMYDEKHIKKLVPCDDEAFEMYRY